MRDLDSLEFHPTSEKIVDILCQMTQNDNPEFFRVLLCYYESKVAATMRVKLATKDRGEIPVNVYAMNLATSGFGKGHSINIIEEQLIHIFQERFFSETFPIISNESIAKIALKRAVIQDLEEDAALELVEKEFADLGEFAFSFDSGTPAAIKQMRHMLLMSNIGSLNLEIDEIGSNLVGNSEALNTYLEMYDVGKIKQKLTKNTKENTRNKEMIGRTPANLMMFGTAEKLFDGGKIEDELFSFFDTGYARRCFFGSAEGDKKDQGMTPEEVFDVLTDTSTSDFLRDMAVRFGELADITNVGKVITVDKQVSILIIDYRLSCERKAALLGPHESMAKAELSHRYFKAMKLAGVYAFMDGDDHLSKENFYHAVKMAEMSGVAFSKILNRDRPYMKLAKYLGTIGHEVTLVDLAEDLTFFRGSVSAKNELLQYAIAWGHKNHIVIKRTVSSGIEFLKGETLKKVDLGRLRLAHSADISDGYKNVLVPWDDLHKLTQQPMRHWITHHSINGHRDGESMVPGFDMIVLDVDDGTKADAAVALLKEYKFLMYTTKRHNNTHHRFRIVMPLNYQIFLNGKEFRLFMKNIYEWLPFAVDEVTNQRAKKWLTHAGQHYYNDGEKHLDARLFIPKTAKNDERQKFIATYQTMTNMERWFLNRSENGNRNNQLARYGLLMVDLGYDATSIRDAVTTMNSKLPDKLKEAEIDQTIMVSVAKKIAKQDTP